MRGFKAKALRRLAKNLYPDDTTPVYKVSGETGIHWKMMMLPTGVLASVPIINPIFRADKARQLYRKLKKEVTRGALN